MLTQDYSDIFARSGNEAVQINPAIGTDLNLSTHGSNWFWTLFSVFVLASILSFGHSLIRPRNERLFHKFTVFSFIVLSIQYFTLASNLGWTAVQAEFNHLTVPGQSITPAIRQFFYARWVGYFLAFPPFIINFAILSGVSWSDALLAVASVEIFVVNFLIGPLIRSSYKWGYFVFGVVGLIVLGYILTFRYRKSALDLDYRVSKHATGLAAGATFLLLIYPIAWGLSDGGNVIKTTSEGVFYGILDLAFFILLNAFLHFVVNTINFTERGISGFQNRVFSNVIIASHLNNTTEKVTAPAEPTPDATVNATNTVPRDSNDTATHAV